MGWNLNDSIKIKKEGRKEMFYLNTHLTGDEKRRKEGIVLFNDTLNRRKKRWKEGNVLFKYALNRRRKRRMMQIKEPLLLIEKSSPCGSNRFPLSLSEWSFTICLTPYNRK